MAALLFVACGNSGGMSGDDTGGDDTSGDTDPSSSVPCPRELGFPGAPSLHAGGGRLVAVADLSADGRTDLITVNAATLSVYLRGADGSYGAAATYPVDDGTQRIRLRDANNDGFPDVLVEGMTVQQVFWNDGTGALSKTTVPQPGPADLADVNGDGKLDLLANSSSLIVWLNTGNGFSLSSSVSTSAGAVVLVAGDLNGDGHDDVVRAGTGAMTCH